MKAAVYYDRDDIRAEEMPVPEIDEGEVLLKIHACGLCGTDIYKITRKAVATPIVLGHEIAGEMIKTGSGVKEFRPGDRVTVAHHLPCFTCELCRSGHHSLCPDFKKLTISPGGFTEYIRVNARGVTGGTFKIPDGLSYEEASLAEPIGCCLRALGKVYPAILLENPPKPPFDKGGWEASPRVGDKTSLQETQAEACGYPPNNDGRHKCRPYNFGISIPQVIVIGLGPIGMIYIQLAKVFGAKSITGLDTNEERLKKAEDFGADEAINPLDEKKISGLKKSAAALIIVACGGEKAIETALTLAGPGSKILIFAESSPDTFVRLDPNKVYHQELTLLSSYSSTPAEQKEALELLASKRLNLKPLITHRFPLEKLSDAVKLTVNPKKSLKIIITP